MDRPPAPSPVDRAEAVGPRPRLSSLLDDLDAQCAKSARFLVHRAERNALFRDHFEAPLAPFQRAWFDSMEVLSTAANRNDTAGAVAAAGAAARALSGVRGVCARWLRLGAEWRDACGPDRGDLTITPEACRRPGVAAVVDRPLLRWARYVEECGGLPDLPAGPPAWQSGPHFLLQECLSDERTPESNYRRLFGHHPLERIRGSVVALAVARVCPPAGYAPDAAHRPRPNCEDVAIRFMAATMVGGRHADHYLEVASEAVRPAPRPYFVAKVPVGPVPPPRPGPPPVEWDPTGEPIHFLIELHDVLRGGYDRFLTLPPGDPRIPTERASLETLRHDVHRRIVYGPLRDSVVSRAVERLTRLYVEMGHPYDPSEVTNLIGVGVMNPLMGLSAYPPVHPSDFLRTSDEVDSAEARHERVVNTHRSISQGDCSRVALEARADLFARLAALAHSPAGLPVRGVNGPGVAPFSCLPPTVPTFVLAPVADAPSTARTSAPGEDAGECQGANQAPDPGVTSCSPKWGTAAATRTQREQVISEAISQSLGDGNDEQKATNAKIVTIKFLELKTGVSASTIDRSDAYEAFAVKYEKRRKQAHAAGPLREVPLTDQIQAARPNRTAQDPAEAAAEYEECEAHFRAEVPESKLRKHDGLTRDEQREAVISWSADRLIGQFSSDS